MSESGQKGNTRGLLSMSRVWAWTLTIGLLVVALLVVVVPQLNFWFSVYWGYQGLKDVFYQDLQWSDAWSTFAARVLAFFYGVAWTPLLYVAYRGKAKQIAIAFLCYVFLFGLIPFLKGAFGTEVCFNQKTGVAEKWYARSRDGIITLYDSPGYTSDGIAKRQVTTEICHEYQWRKVSAPVHQLTGDPREIEFFRADDGSAKVWHDIGPDRKVRLFDGPGFDPDTGEQLKPATTEVRAEAIHEWQQARDAEAAELRRQQDAAEAKAKHEQEVVEHRRRQEEQGRLHAAIARFAEQQREEQLHCTHDAKCSVRLGPNGITEAVPVPQHKTTCFDHSFWDNLDQLGYQTSYHGSAFTDYPCTKAQSFSGACGARYMDQFRFKPQPGVLLPRYWFVDEGARKC